MTRILICGGRRFADREKLYDVLDLILKEGSLEIGCGYDPRDPKFQGADQLAYEWAKARGVPGRCYPAHWDRFGNAAGPMRNARMLEQFGPDEVLAFPGNRGTANMMDQARAAHVNVFQVDVSGRTNRSLKDPAREALAAKMKAMQPPSAPLPPPDPTGFGRARVSK